jgi:hypothetical protein
MPAFPGGDSTQLVSEGGAYYLAVSTGRTASYSLSQVGRVCKIINGSTTQAPNITFTDGNNWQFFNAQAMAPNEVIDLNFPPYGGIVTIAFSAAASGPLTVTLV